MDALKNNNERLWFTVCLRFAKIKLDLLQFDPLDAILIDLLDAILIELKGKCRDKVDSTKIDDSKASLLLEVLAFEI